MGIAPRWDDAEPNAIAVVGYHGTTLARASRIELDGFSWRERLGDWLGGGVYFWQDAPRRAWEWAEWVARRVERRYPELGPQEPSVVRARIMLTPNRMDLIDLSPWQDRLRTVYRVLSRLDFVPDQLSPIAASVPHPRDFAVLSMAAKLYAVRQSMVFDAARAAFIEGSPLYEQSALYDRSHVQIVVRDLALIYDIRRLEGPQG